MRHLRPAGRLAFFLLSHCQFPKRQVSLTWSASRENRLHSCLAHTCMCTHTHTQVRKEREKMRHLMKDGKQVFFLCFGALWVFVGQLWHWGAPVMSFVCASGPNKSLLRNLWEAWAVGKECPLSWSSTLILIIHWRRGAPASGWQEFTHCWPQ